jgi:4-hydroxy-3-polyprenylbenzoate decarboxylase
VRGPKCSAPTFDDRAHGERHSSDDVRRFCDAFAADAAINRFRMIVLVDDSAFVAEALKNFLWVTFTRTNPAADIDGTGAFMHNKHWGCRGALVLDARIKPHHAPVLEEDPKVTRRIESLAVEGGPLYGLF